MKRKDTEKILMIFTRRQLNYLQSEADLLGVSRNEIVRKMVDEKIDQVEKQARKETSNG